MQTITTIGLDIAKSVFQVHSVDAAGQVVIRRQLKRRAILEFFQKRTLGKTGAGWLGGE
jgi:transposase